MSVEVEPVVSDVTEHEFQQACDGGPGCPCPATYALWCKHNSQCTAGHAFCCDAHEKSAEYYWRDATDWRDPCAACGWIPSGELSDNYRAIRL